MAHSLTAAKSLASLHLSASPLLIEIPALDLGAQSMQAAHDVAAPVQQDTSSAAQDYGTYSALGSAISTTLKYRTRSLVDRGPDQCGDILVVGGQAPYSHGVMGSRWMRLQYTYSSPHNPHMTAAPPMTDALI